MTPTLLQRAVWLAAITLVAAVAALAITRRDAGGNNNLPGAVAVPGTENGYYSAKAAPYGPPAHNRRTACGHPFLKSTEGVAHPVLPCGVRLYVRFHGREVLTQVVDRGPNVPGREFDVTQHHLMRVNDEARNRAFPGCRRVGGTKGEPIDRDQGRDASDDEP